jgi:two-component system response regulator PilR (NtrC family)
METAIEALKAGAFDFISKPIELDRLRELVETAIAFNTRQQKSGDVKQLLGTSAEIEQIRSKIDKLTRSMAPVHITGESGTGKELVAHLIHHHGPYADKPFIAVNCSAIPTELMESEFFGHVKGSFTGAHSDKEGLFRAAEGGTLFLDEIADLPLPMQSKLLRAIQERTIRPVGAHDEIPIHCRILSATHKKLRDLVESGKFREDLYYRVNVIELEVPPLRDHPEDIPLLAEKILASVVNKNRMMPKRLDRSALDFLCGYSYPGNIRELENILERAAALSDDTITSTDLALPSSQPAPSAKPGLNEHQNLDDYLDYIERNLIIEALEACEYNKTRAAERLGISFRSIRYKMKKLSIGKNGPPA